MRKTGASLFSDTFPEIGGNFLRQNIVQYKGNIDDSAQKLLLEDVDFELSQNNKPVVNMKCHTS